MVGRVGLVRQVSQVGLVRQVGQVGFGSSGWFGLVGQVGSRTEHQPDTNLINSTNPANHDQPDQT
jgi:hypothetical protein